MIVRRVCDQQDKGFACVSVKKMKKPHEAPPLLLTNSVVEVEEETTWPRPKVPFALSTKRRLDLS